MPAGDRVFRDASVIGDAFLSGMAEAAIPAIDRVLRHAMMCVAGPAFLAGRAVIAAAIGRAVGNAFSGHLCAVHAKRADAAITTTIPVLNRAPLPETA